MRSGMKDKTHRRSKRFVHEKRYEGQNSSEEQEICPSYVINKEIGVLCRK
jgi:hypothetical protein